MLKKKTVIALSVAALAATTVALPAAAAGTNQPVQLAGCGACKAKKAGCGACGAKKAGCGACSAKKAGCGACGAKKAGCGACGAKKK
jgi:hypothetical protein